MNFGDPDGDEVCRKRTIRIIYVTAFNKWMTP